MSKAMDALLEAAREHQAGIAQHNKGLAQALERIADLQRHEADNKPHDSKDVRLGSLHEIKLPAHDGAREMLDIRAAYVLQSYVNLGHPASREEASEIAVRAGYESGRGANVYFTHDWLRTSDAGREITDKGVQWLKQTGRRALLNWLSQ